MGAQARHVSQRVVSLHSTLQAVTRTDWARCCAKEITVAQSSKAVLRRAFKHLEREVPESVGRQIRNLRHPNARWIRIPLGLLLILGGVFSILPLLGIWMLPLGLLLIAYDVPFLRRPVGRFTIWSASKWASFRYWLKRKWDHA